VRWRRRHISNNNKTENNFVSVSKERAERRGVKGGAVRSNCIPYLLSQWRIWQLLRKTGCLWKKQRAENCAICCTTWDNWQISKQRYRNSLEFRPGLRQIHGGQQLKIVVIIVVVSDYDDHDDDYDRHYDSVVFTVWCGCETSCQIVHPRPFVIAHFTSEYTYWDQQWPVWTQQLWEKGNCLYELVFALHSALSADPPSEMISHQHQMKRTSAVLLIVIISSTWFVVSHNVFWKLSAWSICFCSMPYILLQGIWEKRTAMTVCSKVVFSRSDARILAQFWGLIECP